MCIINRLCYRALTRKTVAVITAIHNTMDLNTMPALTPLRGNYTALTVGLGLTVAILPLILRVFTKTYTLRQMKIEDYLLILSVAGLIGYSPVLVVASHTGQGIHQWNLTVKQFLKTLNLTNVLELVYCLVILPAKLSVLIQLKRILL
ncbi:hypothetical protein BGW36DRAFT_379842 [Talaromyces proteolyticus]|uniref:Rhodopsin domain-containing protein n=1 Tax=Talaromyces proteolyticus TaxID=1131652 RepID=A0AAD4KW48_9EURO|nr:uncharacterized protein BGW36DRAFT_379842 [Talaromyces proteolyticus]KAH8698001.1 hypothetical protein BGW36DRAFT_379842 [Talaromyces proteolyticus]